MHRATTSRTPRKRGVLGVVSVAAVFTLVFWAWSSVYTPRRWDVHFPLVYAAAVLASWYGRRSKGGAVLATLCVVVALAHLPMARRPSGTGVSTVRTYVLTMEASAARRATLETALREQGVAFDLIVCPSGEEVFRERSTEALLRATRVSSPWFANHTLSEEQWRLRGYVAYYATVVGALQSSQSSAADWIVILEDDAELPADYEDFLQRALGTQDDFVNFDVRLLPGHFMGVMSGGVTAVAYRTLSLPKLLSVIGFDSPHLRAAVESGDRFEFDGWIHRWCNAGLLRCRSVPVVRELLLTTSFTHH